MSIVHHQLCESSYPLLVRSAVANGVAALHLITIGSHRVIANFCLSVNVNGVCYLLLFRWAPPSGAETMECTTLGRRVAEHGKLKRLARVNKRRRFNKKNKTKQNEKLARSNTVQQRKLRAARFIHWFLICDDLPTYWMSVDGFIRSPVPFSACLSFFHSTRNILSVA